jgi:type IV pilus assembly protein PilW
MTRKRTQLGLSLVELMVAMVIGLIVMIVVYQMFVVSEGTRRTSIAGNDAQMSAAIAMSALQDGIRNGGYGLNSSDLSTLHGAGVWPLGCDVKGYSAGTGAFISFKLNPVTITQGADNNALTGVGKDSDSITVVYSDLPYPTVPINLQTSMGNTTDPLVVTNPYSIAPGNVLILADKPGQINPAQGAQSTPLRTPYEIPVCALAEATGAPAAANVAHAMGTYVDLNGNNKAVRFNGPGGIGATAGNPTGLMFKAPTASIYNLGTNPSAVTFSVQKNPLSQNWELVMSNLLGDNTKQSLVDGVLSLQAQYGVGVDTNGDGYADVFNPSAGQGAWQATTPANPGLVMAVRLAVLTRANLMDAKDKTSGLCNATPATSPELGPLWGDLVLNQNFDVTGTVDWDCYRYKRFEMVVPLRNMFWMP